MKQILIQRLKNQPMHLIYYQVCAHSAHKGAGLIAHIQFACLRQNKWSIHLTKTWTISRKPALSRTHTGDVNVVPCQHIKRYHKKYYPSCHFKLFT